MYKIYYSLFIFLFSVSLAYGQSIFINEVNYKASNLVNQGFEISGPEDTNLNGWSVTVYNPGGDVRSVKSLNGYVIPSHQARRGDIWVDMEQSADGAGLALINADNQLIQFLSYGTAGALTALEGAASGQTAEYIGSQVAAALTLQLTGIGNEYIDFIWLLPGNATAGNININQIYTLPPLFLNGLGGAASSMQPAQMIDDQSFTNKNLHIETWPNPVADRLQVRLPAEQPVPALLRLFDQNGRLTRQIVLGAGAVASEVDFSQLPSGTYILQLDGYDAAKIVKR